MLPYWAKREVDRPCAVGVHFKPVAGKITDGIPLKMLPCG